MRNLIYSLVILVFAVGLISCSSDNDNDLSNDSKNLELRATLLGFPDVDSYQVRIAGHCVTGNHQNCDILDNGTHQVCAYPDHSGTKYNGSHHNGSNHGIHDANGHSHNSAGKGNHH